MDEVTTILKSAYNAVKYSSYPHGCTHPDRLAVVAALRGMAFPDVEKCRVLEIGCASGGNIIPMAEQLPQSRFLGIDLAENQIKDGLDWLGKLDLANVELRCQDLMEFSAREGKFDYIIAHGVYSWVPAPVQRRLLEVCRDHLSPMGLAFISYNAYPGWRSHNSARDMMLFRARRSSDSAERAALGRQIAQFVASHAAGSHLYNETARMLAKPMGEMADEGLLHDLMGPVNEPQLFWKFMEEAGSHGLAYVGEADGIPDPWLKVSPTAREGILAMSKDEIEREQYLDFIVGRPFRTSVLCAAEALSNAGSPGTARFSGLYVAGSPPEIPMGTDERGRAVFQYGDGVYKAKLSDSGSIVLLRRLGAAWPLAVPYGDLLPVLANHEAAKLKPTVSESLDDLLGSYYKLGLIELWPRATTMIAPKPGSCPRMTLRARLEASHTDMITSLRHLRVKVDLAVRQLIPLLDGSRDKSALVAELVRLKKTGGANQWPDGAEQIDERVGVILNLLAKLSLLVN